MIVAIRTFGWTALAGLAFICSITQAWAAKADRPRGHGELPWSNLTPCPSNPSGISRRWNGWHGRPSARVPGSSCSTRAR